MKNQPLGRLIAALLMIGLVAWGYWWLILIAACIFLFVYRSYYEIILWGIIFDAVYAAPPEKLFDYRAHIATLLAIALFFLTIFLKKRLAFYS